MRNILSTKDLTKEDLEKILERASVMEEQCKYGKVEKLLADKIIACTFFEPSTRTRLSFETAALKLGAQIITVENGEVSSSAFKGESVEDTTRMLCSYADAVVIRHPKSGTAEKAARVATKPILNAGDGANQHPSQALLDTYTIKKEFGRLENLSIAYVGDLLNSRPLHSILPLMNMYEGNKFYFVSPKELMLGEEFKKELRDKNVEFSETDNLEEILPKVDVLYITRVQKERFENLADYEKVKDAFLLKAEHLNSLKKDAVIMHALPRVNEIDPDIDMDSRAGYFRQAQNGLYTRMSMLLYALDIK
ncbi:aspartate carbamoyltransferase [Patescibacteria group bacterium]|nr:aspartate carbamoyltransferase [Patescibacteria group bacterium]